MPRTWKILDIIELIKKYGAFLPLLKFPDWENAEAVRLRAVKLLEVADGLADGTENQIDDALVDFGRILTTNPQTWSTFYELIWDIFTGETGGAEGDDRITVLAHDVGVSPTIIIMIFTEVIQLIKWWRDRRDQPS